MKKIGILTSGGDSPGMNAAVVSVARSAAMYGIQLMGIKRGYNGLLGLSDDPEDDITLLDLETVLDIADQRGTFLRTARCEEFKKPEVQREAAENLRKIGIDALVVIGGDGSFQGALRLSELGIPCVCIPGTIDNDLGYTESTLGYDTAVNVCVDAVRSVRATSRSHDRPAVVQVMGRNAGDIAMRTAIATGAEMVVVPEMEWDVDALAARLNSLIAAGNTRATLVMGEHCWHKMKPFDWRKFLSANGKPVHEGEPISAERLASILKRKCGGAEVRATVIGYTQRGAIPTAYDSAFAFEAGNMAVRLLNRGITNQAVGVRHGRVFSMPIADALNMQKHFDRELYELVNKL
ncbi:MAG: ATP-dependent 6-phosphofructokinase [Candidatus Limiplasma sp.]|nr:ATP-dependent 6-phosphofructokinase [Candidatus Limiplasma sp.]